MQTAYLRRVEFEGTMQWVLFDEDGVWIAASLDKWRIHHLAGKSGIKVVTLQ
jgi:uncharacterized protein YccT (UPF0319 family)